MKRALFILSLVLMTAWIVGVFLFKASFGIHVLLVLSILAYLRSLMIVEASPSTFFDNKKW